MNNYLTLMISQFLVLSNVYNILVNVWYYKKWDNAKNQWLASR